MIEFEADVYPPGRTGGMTRLKGACQAQHQRRGQTSTPTRVGQQGVRQDSRGEIGGKALPILLQTLGFDSLVLFLLPAERVEGDVPAWALHPDRPRTLFCI